MNDDNEHFGAPDEDGYRVDFTMNDAIRGAASGSSVNAERERHLRALSGMDDDAKKRYIREALQGTGSPRDRLLARLALDNVSEAQYGSIPE